MLKIYLYTNLTVARTMEVLISPEGLLSLLTLTFLEIVLGIDNIIFISLISNDLDACKELAAVLAE